MKDISTLEAVTQVTEVFHLDECSPTTRKPTEFKEPHLQEYIDNTIETFAVTRQAQDYLELRGFSGESMLRFRFGFDSGKNAIVIPYGFESTYYISRSLVGKQFFKPRTEVAGPEPLFYEESLDQDEPVFVVESAFCALSIMQEGGYAVSPNGTAANKFIGALKKRASLPPMIVCMDRDEAGAIATEKICDQLKALRIVHLTTTTPEGYKDPNELLMSDPGLFSAWLRDAVEQAKELPPIEKRIRRNGITVPANLYTLCPESNERFKSSDIGNSRLFADFYKDIVRYVPERKLWYVFDGMRWIPDVGNLKTMDLCMELADILLVYVAGIEDDDLKRKFGDNWWRWQIRRTRETILKDAQGVYPVHMTEFDVNPYLLNCQNGTLNLKTKEFLPHDANDKLTKISDVIFDPDAHCERFDAFINEIMSGDRERADFLQRSLGYALSGDTRFECLFILFGATTRNGKGTLMESVLNVMGDYGSTVRPETISMKQNVSSQNPTEDIARLAGIRFANISEPSRGLLLNAAQVKSMTGNDTLNARFLHENSFDFQPQFKIYMNTNYLPVITDMTLFSSGRIMIIPFERHFEVNQQDKTLKQTFVAPENQSAILNWLLEGYCAVKWEGLNLPESVRFATERYRHESDKVGLFIEDEMEPISNAEERTSAVYDRYKKWCDANGCFAENTRNFKQILAMYGRVERKRPYAGGSETTMFIGFRLRFDKDGFTEYKGKIPFD